MTEWNKDKRIMDLYDQTLRLKHGLALMRVEKLLTNLSLVLHNKELCQIDRMELICEIDEMKMVISNINKSNNYYVNFYSYIED